MLPISSSSKRLVFVLILLASFSLGWGRCHRGDIQRTIVLEAADDLEFQIRAAFIEARPGDEILLPRGIYDIRSTLSLDVPQVALKGQGSNQTILSFANQVSGAEGFLVTADGFTMTDLAIEDTTGDGLKVEGADGLTVQRVRVEWTGGADTDNGAYGIYPVQCREIVIEDSVVIGASDAGIYVGQSDKIIVRRNRVEQNVAGIEIENSTNADVYLNVAEDNTGGILVFDLPNLPIKGHTSRVFGNVVVANNTPNFAPEGNIVGLVPQGTGLMIMANDDIEVFGNLIADNQTANLLIVSYLVTFIPITDENYDPYPERIYVYDNTIYGGGLAPEGLGSVLTELFSPTPVPDMVWDGFVNPEIAVGGMLPPGLEVCFQNNGNASFGTLNGLIGAPSLDLAPFDCSHAGLDVVDVAQYPDRPPFEPPFSDEEVAMRCTAPGSDVNAMAIEVDCPLLSDYRLFLGNDVRNSPNGGVPFDLTTPLFSDYAEKYRFVFVPDGTAAQYDEDAAFDFPVGTVIAKTFSFVDDKRMPELGETLIETRLLIHREDGWIGLPYVWNEEQTEATLAKGGSAVQVSWIDLAGDPRDTRYEIPNVNQCAGCHESDGGDLGDAPIGPKARFLNDPFDYGGATGVVNQLDHWSALGILDFAPPSASAPRAPVWDDEMDGTLDDRARAYLDINCAHCHHPDGSARTSGLFLGSEISIVKNPTQLGLCKPPVAAGPGSGGFQYDVVPGMPEESILVFRMDSVAPAIKMPELAKSVVHDEGVALIADWVAQLAGDCL